MLILRAVVTVLLMGAFALDVAGRFLSQSALWTLGARANALGVVCGLVVWCTAWFGPVRSGQISWLCALAAFALARFLRGSAGVPPDPPLLVLTAIGSLLLAFSWWRRRRASLRQQSRAAVPPPA